MWSVLCQRFIGASDGLLPQCPPVPVPCLSSAQALDPTELKGEGLLLSLEEQLGALTLSELQSSEPPSTVSLNGECFNTELFEDTRESTKVLCHLCPAERTGTLHMFVHWMAELGLFDCGWSNCPFPLEF